MNPPAFTLRQAYGSIVEAALLVNPVPFSARYDLDRTTGVISRADHPLCGRSVAGKILLSPRVQGGVAAAWALLPMAHQGIGAAALIFGELNPVMVQGAVTAGVPIGAGIEQRAFDELVTDTLVRFDPANHTLTVLDQTHGASPPRTDA